MSELNSYAKRWCFTLNNYTDENETTIRIFIPTYKDFVYLIYGKEVAPTTGTPHLQGFIAFKERTYGKMVKRLFRTESVSIRVAKGSVTQNIEYCSKDGDVIEIGEAPLEQWEKGAEATKRKWEEARNAAQNGDFENIPTDLWIKHRNSWIAEYNDFQMKENLNPIEDDIKQHFIWIYGPTGTGKSHWAREIASKISDEQPYLKLVNKWWHGFHGQKVTIIEEVQPDIPMALKGMMKQWLDKWPFAAETKGGMISNLRPKYIIITSNYSIDHVFGNWDPKNPDEEPEETPDSKAVKRRVYIWFKRSVSMTLQWPDSIWDDDELVRLARQDAHRDVRMLVGVADAPPPNAQGNTSPRPERTQPLDGSQEVPASPEY